MFGGRVGVIAHLRAQLEQTVLEKFELRRRHVVRFWLLHQFGFGRQASNAGFDFQ